MRERIHADDRASVYEAFQEALRQKRDYAVEYRIVLPDGTIKYLEATAHHQFSADGELVEVIGTNVDVTERKRAQEELEKLRQLEANLAQTIGSASTCSRRSGCRTEHSTRLSRCLARPAWSRLPPSSATTR